MTHRVAELEEAVRCLQDRHEVLELAARYHELCDGGWDGPLNGDPDAPAELFTEDGTCRTGDDLRGARPGRLK